ncbi:MAG TPA: SRPBCC domain-containing protein [Solirubrobacteraceae bacterium]|jgi:uncharacterized protein YndB with AHSA1/START domain|nr:SRPBCC domain-containing protein [Solirubrobacteraceae bacterium]
MTETLDTSDAVMTSETSLRIERSYDASPEEVFDAWTNPEVLRRWWAVHPDGSTPVAEVDLREGGRYRLSMEGPDAERHTVQGEYLEVDRPSRLVYSWRWELDAGGLGPASTVTVEFCEQGERTNVVLEHAGLPDADSRDRHAEGWAACMDIFRERGFSAAA